jgi:hypothetical protein
VFGGQLPFEYEPLHPEDAVVVAATTSMFSGFASAVSFGLSLPVCHAPSPKPLPPRNEPLERRETKTSDLRKVGFAYPNKIQEKVQALRFITTKYQQFIDPTNIPLRCPGPC